VSPLCLKKFVAYKRNKAKSDPYRMCFACSLEKILLHFSASFHLFLLSFFGFASINLFSLRSETKRNLFSVPRLFQKIPLLILHFFFVSLRFFHFILLNSHSFSLQIFSRLSNVSVLFRFPWFFLLVSLRFRFRFLQFRFDVKKAKSCLFSLSSKKRFSRQFHFLLQKRKRGRTRGRFMYMYTQF
jgi:hypothetical protein